MITDILIAVAIGGVIAFLLYLVSNSARSAQKGNAPVVETALTKKEREQQKQEQEEKVVAAPRPTAAAASTSSSSANNKTEKKAASSSPVTSSPKSSSPATSNTSSPKSATAKKNSKKTKKELDAEEEAEMDAFVAQELKRTGNQGIRKEKFEIVSLEDIQKNKEKQAARQVKKAEGAHFSDKQVASEKAAGFRVVGAQEAAKKEAREQAKANAPAVELDEEGNPIKKRREPMTREEELDAALRSVLSKRGNKKGGFGGSGGFGGERRQKEDGDKTADGKGVVDIKGEVTAPRPGGAWTTKEEKK